MKNKTKRNVFILSLCVVASISFMGKSLAFETTPVEAKEASINSVPLSHDLVDEEERVLESYLDKYGSESSINASKALNTIEKVLTNNYGTKASVSYRSNIPKALEAIDEGHAVHMSIINSSTYGNHGVVLIGYQMYSYKTGWWIFKSTHYAYFYEIADGWRDSPKYFDPNTDANPSLYFSILEK